MSLLYFVAMKTFEGFHWPVTVIKHGSPIDKSGLILTSNLTLGAPTVTTATKLSKSQMPFFPEQPYKYRSVFKFQ